MSNYLKNKIKHAIITMLFVKMASNHFVLPKII